MSIKLKKSLLPIVVAEASDLPLGTLGEFITADTLKPYLDRIEAAVTTTQLAAAIVTLKTELFGGVDISADTFAELNAKIGALQNLTDADKTGILNQLAGCVRTADIMPLLNGKADEVSVVDRLLGKADVSFVQSELSTQNLKHLAESQARAAEDVRIETIANSKASVEYVNSQASSAELEGKRYTQNEMANLNENVLPLLASKTLVTQKIADSVQAQRLEAYTNQEANNVNLLRAIAEKATPAEATAISTALVGALRTEMLAIEGIDDAEFARLGALLAQLTALEAGDVTGIMALLSQKLDKSVFDSIFTFVPTRTGFVVRVPGLIEFDNLYTRQLSLSQEPQNEVSGAVISDYLSNPSPTLNEQTVLIEHGGVIKTIPLLELVSVLVTNANSPFALKFVDKSNVLGESWFTQNMNPADFIANAHSYFGSDSVINAIAISNVLKALKENHIDLKVDKGGIVSDDFLKGRYDITNSFEFITNQTLLERSDEEIFGGKALTKILRNLYNHANTKVDVIDVLPLAWFANIGYSDSLDLLGFVNTPDDDFLEHRTFSMKVIKYLFKQVINAKASKTEVQTLRDDLATANQEIASLRADVEMLKSYFEQAA